MKFVKDKEYYESLDKRTKEYKEWKEYMESKEGLGDKVEKVAKAVGADKVAQSVAEKLGYKDCGCSDRKEKLNEWGEKLEKVFSFRKKPKHPLKEEEYVDLHEFFDKRSPRVTVEEQKMVLGIYNRVFEAQEKPSNCPGCFKRVTDRLRMLIRAHKL